APETEQHLQIRPPGLPAAHCLRELVMKTGLDHDQGVGSGLAQARVDLLRKTMLGKQRALGERQPVEEGVEALKQGHGCQGDEQSAPWRDQCSSEYQTGDSVTMIFPMSSYLKKFLVLLVLPAAMAAAAPPTGQAPTRPKLVLAIAVDQFRYDYL